MQVAVEAIMLPSSNVRTKVQLLNPRQLHRFQCGRLVRHYRVYYYVDSAVEARSWHARLVRDLPLHVPDIVVVSPLEKTKSPRGQAE